MATKTNFAISQIKQNGIADPWQKFGMLLSNDGAISTYLVREVFKGRESDYTNLNEIFRLFYEKTENLIKAKELLADTMTKYDMDGIWNELDESIAEFDIEEAIKTLEEDFDSHPFPIVLNSLRFNWTFMKNKSVREFYVMTNGYLNQLLDLTNDALVRFEKEKEMKIVEPYWLIKMDLNSIETPCHCDVCRLTISYILEIRNINQNILTPSLA